MPDAARTDVANGLAPVRGSTPPPSAPLTLVPAAVADEELVRRLALDRLRDLHDDGLAGDYIGRMYGVSGAAMQSLEKRLRAGLRRGGSWS